LCRCEEVYGVLLSAIGFTELDHLAQVLFWGGDGC
jgi:hypothetical protein